MNCDDTPHSNDFYVEPGTQKLDLTWVTNTLLGTYWGGWRTHDMIAESIRNSVCFGLYEHRPQDVTGPTIADRQIGFARVITDHATFSWLCDVIIDPAYRGRKLGKFLVGTIVRHPCVAKTVCLLKTRDAHGLYRQFDFTDVSAMSRIPTKPTL